MAVYHADEDAGRGLITYCTEEDVLLLMAGVMPDAEGDTLQAFASSETLTRIVDSVLATTKLALDDECGRDFDLHDEVEVAVDGSGSDELDIGRYGFRPLLALDAMAIGGSTCTLTDYTWDQAGVISPTDYWGGYPIFYRGYRNVALTITWGYEQVPADVVMAQTKLAGVEVFGRIVAANAAEPGMIGGAQRIQFGDLNVTHYGRGRYSATIDAWKADVAKVVAKYRRLRIVNAKPKSYDQVPGTRLKQFRED